MALALPLIQHDEEIMGHLTIEIRVYGHSGLTLIMFYRNRSMHDVVIGCVLAFAFSLYAHIGKAYAYPVLSKAGCSVGQAPCGCGGIPRINSPCLGRLLAVPGPSLTADMPLHG